MKHFVYILKLVDNSFYIGYTKDLKSRLEKHNYKQCSTTKNKLPIKLYWYCVFNNERKARTFETYLKSGSGTAFRNKRLI